MKLHTIVALLATVEATQISAQTSDEPVKWPIKPYSPNSHALYCRVWGQDLRFGPCPIGRNLSREAYPDGHFERL